MMLAPVKQTMPAISMEYQRALGSRVTGCGWGSLQTVIRQVRGEVGEGEKDTKKGTLK